MKQLLVIATLALFTACGGTEQKTKASPADSTVAATPVSDKKFACPMKCEGEKTYAKADTCPVCSMTLQEIAMAETDSTTHAHE